MAARRTHLALGDSIKELMRNSAQPVGVITAFLATSSSASSSSSSSPVPPRQVHGATLSSFTTVSMAPPLVAFSLRAPSRLADALCAGAPKFSVASEDSKQGQGQGKEDPKAHFVINILAHGQAHIAAAFARPLASFNLDSPGTAQASSAGGAGAAAHPLATANSIMPSRIAGGVPILRGALGALACSVVARIDLAGLERTGLSSETSFSPAQGSEQGAVPEQGASQLFVARVHDVEWSLREGGEGTEDDARPLVYWRQQYSTVAEPGTGNEKKER